MKKKHFIIALVISLLWGLIFSGMAETDIRNSIAIFNTKWLDVLQAILTGIIMGLIIRIQIIRNYIEAIPFGSLLTGVAAGILGLGAIGIGIVGAIIVYFRFEAIELIKLPLHASIVGLSLYVIYLTLHWGESEKI